MLAEKDIKNVLDSKIYKEKEMNCQSYYLKDTINYI